MARPHEVGMVQGLPQLNDFFEEFYRRDGKVFAENDDLLCAVRYALMMLRYASTDAFARNFNGEINTRIRGDTAHDGAAMHLDADEATA